MKKIIKFLIPTTYDDQIISFLRKNSIIQYPIKNDDHKAFFHSLYLGTTTQELEKITEKNEELRALFLYLKDKRYIGDVEENPYLESVDEKNFYFLQKSMENLNKSDPSTLQNSLAHQSILILGLGGIGSIIAQNLVAMGFKRFILLDKDKIEISNLNRQCFYQLKDIGQYKTTALKNYLFEQRSDLDITSINCELKHENDLKNLLQNHSFHFICHAIDTPYVSSRLWSLELAKTRKVPVLFMGAGIETQHIGPLITNEQYYEIYEKKLKKMRPYEQFKTLQGSNSVSNMMVATLSAREIFGYITQLWKNLTLNQTCIYNIVNGENSYLPLS